MVNYLKRSWAVVSMDALAHNIRTVQSMLSPGCKLMGVVKADAYGHGDKYIADQMVQLGVSWLGVSNLEEALSLRNQGIYLPILIFGLTPPEHARLLNEYNLTQTIYSMEYAQRLHHAALEADVDINGHIKVDTGMSRLGFVMGNGFAAQSIEEIKEVCALPRLHADGIFTHFACADELNEDSVAYTHMQFGLFRKAIDGLKAKGVRFSLHHCCNSAGTINYPEMHMDMVRPGIILYGISPSEDCAGKVDLRPAMELYSTVAQVKKIPEGTPVSYGRCYTSHRETVVATVPIGYADGYERELSNKARVLVRGKFASVIGRVCMDQIMLDVTHIPGVRPGDQVTIVGPDGDNALTFDEMAALSGTLAYEKICLIGKRIPRIYRRGGKDVGVMDYVRRQSPGGATEK